MIALVRRGRDVSELEALGIGTVEVDLCASNLGLARNTYCGLAEPAHAIVHCAADIRFSVSLEESRQVNVLGTENLLRFAARCPRLAKFAHMSTVYVAGGKPGYIGEQASQPGCFFNPYQQTKFEAERAVLSAMAAIPATIYRFSTMVYNCAAARVSQFNYFHQLLRLAAVNPLQAIPALPSAKIDLIASDWGARIFDFLFAERWEPGQIVHICAGPQNSLTVGELFEMTFDVLGSAKKRPEIISQEEFESRTASILSTASRKRMWQSLSQFIPHMNIDQTFECTRLSEAIRYRPELRLPDVRSMFRNALLYCVATHWGQRYPAQLS
jgi:nucleoside-diphosphate-sugar epimerase